MIYEGVYFNEEEMLKMGRDQFVTHHVKHFWKHLPEEKREKMLGEAYDLIKNTGENEMN